MTKRAWCFTLILPREEEYDELCEWMEEETKYAVIGIEFADTVNETLHIQGYFRVGSAMRWVLKTFATPRG